MSVATAVVVPYLGGIVATRVVATADDHDEHPSVRSLVADGYEVITF